MPMFRRPKTAAPSAVTPTLPPPVPVDPAYGNPDVTRLRATMAARDWPAARAILADRDHHDLSVLVDVASRITDAEEWLPDVVRADLRDTLALLVYGARAITWAWDARTAARAKYVAHDQFAVFHERLRLAEDCLQDVVRREPGNATAWSQMLSVARGLQLGQEEARRRFDQAVLHHPENVRAHWAMLQQLCQKWGGSHELMHTFAREATQTAPPGSPLGHLVAEAYIEEWAYSGDRDFFTRAAVLNAVRRAADRSVRHPDYQKRMGWPIIHNPFAMVFALSNDHVRAAEQFRIIGDLVTEYPWTYLRSGAEQAYANLRARTLARTG